MDKNSDFFLPDFSDLHIAVIGDVMIDRYISGYVKRISPEAPVPILEWKTTENRMGGAANVALNLHELGAQVSLLSVVGDDKRSDILKESINKYNRIVCEFVKDKDRNTTVKTRIVAKNQQLLRVDSEDTHDVSDEKSLELLERLKICHAKKPINGIILQDYNKGVLTEYSISKVIQWANHHSISTFVDPKEKNFFSYKNCTVFKPNKKEAAQALGAEWREDYNYVSGILRQKLHQKTTLITLSDEGLFIGDDQTSFMVPTTVRNISDVSGAGDTVISIVSLCYLKSIPLDQIGRIANLAGGQVCESPGVVPINLSQLVEELKKQ